MGVNVSNIQNSVPAIQKKSELTPDRAQQQVKSNPSSEHKEINNGKEVSKQEVKSTVEKLNDFVDPVRTNLKFVFHEDLHEYYVTVINPLTNEVIREIPPKKMLDMYAAMTEYMGLLVDEKI